MSTRASDQSLLERASPAYRRARSWERSARASGDLGKLPSADTVPAGVMQTSVRTVYGVSTAREGRHAVVILHCELDEGQRLNLSIYLPLAVLLAKDLAAVMPEGVRDHFNREVAKL
jgi:hypothetical protein